MSFTASFIYGIFKMFKTKALCILDKASIFASARNTQPGFSWRTMEVKKIALMKRLLDDHTMLAEMEKFQIWEDYFHLPQMELPFLFLYTPIIKI